MKKVFFMGALCVVSSTYAQQKVESINDSLQQPIKLSEVLVSAVRAKQTLPVTFSYLSKKEITKRNLGQDIPILLNFLPNVVTTSDAGAGIGYTGLRVRGSDASRINVTINGIPYNDSESQGTFWVNISDIASSVENLQLQRGVGTSTNGAGAFGASLNLLTDAISENPYVEIANSYGSYNTHKHTVKLSSGKINDRFELSARLSKINSDGYIERASSDLKSYFLQGAYAHNNTILKFLTFGGNEKTYQAWNGIDANMLKENRRYNPSGKYKDANGNTQFYDNQTDNYEQNHYQLHWTEKWTSNLNTHLALHYTRGLGYYESYQKDRYTKRGLPSIGKDTKGKELKDFILFQKWLDNHFYGITFSANYQKDNWDIIFGGATNRYDGDHYTKILGVQAKNISYDPNQKYLFDNAHKNEGNIFTKITYSLSKKWNLFTDLQYRYLTYKNELYSIDDKLSFFNPKAGITFSPNNKNQIYISYAKAHREPTRKDYENDNNIKPEQLNDFEMGWRFNSDKVIINANLYYMLYKDQLVLTGALSDTGRAIRANSGNSYRTGIELDAIVFLSKKWIWHSNISFNKNKNQNYHIEKDKKLINLRETNITYSPEIIAGNTITFIPIDNLQISLLSKYVGEQYLSNANEIDSKLDSFFVNDLNLTYNIFPKKIFKEINFSIVANNILNKKYVSNGWYDNPYVGYFPQAEANYLTGITFKF